jgi:hypothetical protein
MPLDNVFIACHRGDFRYAKICIASIRHWHKDIPITLLVDLYGGKIPSKDLQNYWGVTVRYTSQPYGSPFSKLEPLFDPPGKKFLILDADTCLIRQLPEHLLTFTPDFVVQKNWSPPSDEMLPLYFDIAKLKSIDPDYEYPGFYINTGQFFGTSGIISKQTLDAFVDWSARPVNSIDRNLFRMNEEAILNYLWISKQYTPLSIQFEEFWDWSESLSIIDDKTKPIVHFAGATKPLLRNMSHFRTLAYYEKEYYSRIPLGKLKHMWDSTLNSTAKTAKRLKGKARKSLAAYFSNRRRSPSH